MVTNHPRCRPGHHTRAVGALLLALGLLLTLSSPPSAGAQERPAGSPVLSDGAAAARVWRTGFEPRRDNADENRRVPSGGELFAFFAQNKTWGACHEGLQRRVTGNFTGTTDEILQWTAQKWGLDMNLVRAVALVESGWRMSFVGDGGDSYGIMQVRRSAHRGTFPLAAQSTAFNADYWGAHVRQYLDGCADWMRSRGGYGRGDLWGSIGAWFCGCWRDGGAEAYTSRVWAARYSQPWMRPGF